MDGTEPINFERSVATRRVKFKVNFSIVIDYFLFYFIGTTFILIATVPILVKFATQPDLPTVVPALAFLFIVWMVSNLILTNTLVKIDRNISKEEINTFFKSYDSNLELKEKKSNIVTYKRSTRLFLNWSDKVITIIFNGEHTYINIMALSRSNSLSSFYGLFNYLKCKKIAKHFQELQASSEKSVI